MIVSVKDLGNGVMEYGMVKAISRIHPGKLTKEERKELWRVETTKYLKEAHAAQKKKNQKRAKA